MFHYCALLVVFKPNISSALLNTAQHFSATAVGCFCHVLKLLEYFAVTVSKAQNQQP